MTKYPKKLIEVAMPLDDINKAAARETLIRHGHPSTLHLWWARRPLAAARAVLFAQLVNDPGGERGWGAYPGQTKEDATRERERLFDIIRDLVKWENTNNEEVLERARAEIRKSWAETCKITGEDPNKMPPFLDPFSGGGTIPLEAQRLGLESHGSDLNPVAVMIGKALIEIPPKFAGRAPIGPIPKDEKNQNLPSKTWKGAEGLGEDVRRYGAWMKEEAFKRIGHLYPKVQVVQEKDGNYRYATAEELNNPKVKVEELTVIAWLWARTIECQNPACGVTIPLLKSFALSTKKGKEAYVQLKLENQKIVFTIQKGDTLSFQGGTIDRSGALCPICKSPIPLSSIRNLGKQGKIGNKLLSIVADGKTGKIYLPPSLLHENISNVPIPLDIPSAKMPDNPRWFSPPQYGFSNFEHIFTNRQLTVLTIFSNLILEARAKAIEDSESVGCLENELSLNEGGNGATAYGDAIAVYLAFAVDRFADYWSSLNRWQSKNQQFSNTFSRQALPMLWEYAEANPFSGKGGSFDNLFAWTIQALPNLFADGQLSTCNQMNACQFESEKKLIISTDPPYYDNIGYADLSDFFYIWSRRSLKAIFPEIFSTLLVPKSEELVATPYRHGGKEEAEKFFLTGMTSAIGNIVKNCHEVFPATIYYAFKQAESNDKGVASTGWETFLDAVIKAGFSITGTLPIRTEMGNRMISLGTNALASSIVLVCRKRDENAPTILRRQFLRELEYTMPEALEVMIGGKGKVSPIAPVDLAQAAIGPGIGVFSQYAAVLEMDGTPMTVRTALTLINKAIDEYFTQAEGDMDAKTRFCVDWFQTYGFKPGTFGEADVLARAKGSAVEAIATSGVLESGSGKVRLYKVSEYPVDWNPETDSNTSIWEACHQLSRSLKESETSAGALLARMPEKSEAIRQLAYRLYTLCERKGWAEDAGNYNELIASWHPLVESSQQIGVKETQGTLPLG